METEEKDIQEQNEAREAESKEQEGAQKDAATPETKEGEGTEATEEKPAEESEEEKLKKEVAELNDKYLRTRAEYDNYRRRTAKERQELIKSAGEDVLKGLLPVMDDFERAMVHIGENAEATALKEGVDIIYKKFADFLAKNGVSVIETQGLPLDTNVHEAVAMMPAPTEDMKGKIMDCVEKGYKLGDKVIRFAKVVVCQ